VLSLPLTLAARLLPVAVLAVGGWNLTTGPRPETDSAPSASQRPSVKAATGPAYEKPPAPCEAISAETVQKLVPGAKSAGKELQASDPKRRTGCSWNALEGFDYRWLDVTFEVSPAPAAREAYDGRKQSSSLPGLGDEASEGAELTEDDGQQTRSAVVVVRKENAVVTLTYNGSDFETRKAPDAKAMHEGALAAAKEAINALDAKGS
jgi:hypothetical protein